MSGISKRVKGITVEINAETKGLDKALKSVNDSAIKTSAELKDVNKLLRFDSSNAEIIAQKQQLLADAVANSSEKLATLKDVQAQVEAQFSRGEIGADQYRAFQREVAATEENLSHLRRQLEAVNQTGTETDRVQQSIARITAESQGLQSELSEINKLLRLDPGNSELVAQKQQILGQEVSNTREKLELLREAQVQVEAQFARGDIGEEAYRRASREIVETERSLSRLETELESVNNQWAESGRRLTEFGEKATKIGKSLSMKVTAPIMAVGAAGVKMGIDLESSLAKVNTIADTKSVPMETLREQIVALSDETGIAAAEVAENIYDAISAGQETADAVNFVTQSTKLATAGFAESGQSLDILTTALNAYGLEADQVTNVSDILITTQKEGKVTVAELAETMGSVIPTASATNVKLEQLAASYVVLTKKGIKANEATSSINGMLNELSKSGTKADVALKEMTGQGFAEAMAGGAELSDILAMLNDYAIQNGISLNDMFGNVRAGKAALSIAAEGGKEFNNALIEMKNSTDATQKAFEIMSEGAEERLTIAFNKIKNAVRSTFQSVIPVLVKIAEAIAKVAEVVSKLPAPFKIAIVSILGIAAAIGPLLILIDQMSIGIGALMNIGGIAGVVTKVTAVFAKLAGVFGTVSTIVTTTTVTVMGITAPLWGVVAVVGAIIGAVALLYKKFKKSKDGIADEAKDLKKKVEKETESINNPKSPKKEYEKIGQDMNAGLEKGLKSNSDKPLKAMEKNAEGLKNTLDKNIADLDKFGNAITTALKNKYEKMQENQINMLGKRLDNEKDSSDKIVGVIEKTTDKESMNLDSRLENLKKSMEKRVEEYEKDYENRIKFLNADTEGKVGSIQGRIDAIDAITEKEEKALEEREYKEKLSDLERKKSNAETAEERAEIQAQIDEQIYNRKRKLLLQSRSDEKNDLKEQIDVIKEKANAQKEVLQTELNDKKKLEQDKLTIVSDALKAEADAIKQHYSRLMEQENIQAEAREMMIRGNQDEMVSLLSSYNPKWQDAGQSLSDSLMNGLDSNKEGISEAVKRSINLVPVIEEQKVALQALEDKIEQIRENDKDILPNSKEGLNTTKKATEELVNGLDKVDKGLEETEKKVEKTQSFLSKSFENFAMDLSTELSEVSKHNEEVFNGISEYIFNATRDFENMVKGWEISMNDWADGAWLKLKDTFGKITSFFGEQLDKVKSFFNNLELKLPEIKLPHFSFDGEFNLMQGKLPKIGVDWFAKGGIMNKPTIFGMNGGNLMGGGEAGKEAIIPIDKLKGWIFDWLNQGRNDNSSDKIVSELSNLSKVLGSNDGSTYDDTSAKSLQLLNSIHAALTTNNNRNQNTSQPIILQLDKSELAKGTIDAIRDYEKQTGRVVLG